VEIEEELSIICVKVVVEGKRRDVSADRCGVHDEEYGCKNISTPYISVTFHVF